MYRLILAKRLWIALLCAALTVSCLPARAETYTLDEALSLVGTPEGRAGAGMVELEGDFSQYNLFGSGEYEMGDMNFIILWREAPLKRFVTSNTPFPEDYEGEDTGEPRLYLCTELMESIPTYLRANSAETATDAIMAETLYYHSGVIYTSTGADEELPSVWELKAVMAGNEEEEVEIPEEEPERTYTYRPVFYCLAGVSLYNCETLGSMLWDYDLYPHAELRDNPEADDQWEDMVLLLEVADAAESGKGAPLREAMDALKTEGFLPSAQSDALARLAEEGNADGIVNLCLEDFWGMAEQLKTLDAEAAELYDMAITERSLKGLFHIVNARSYSGVQMEDEDIRSTESYTGHPDLEALRTMLADTLAEMGLTSE